MHSQDTKSISPLTGEGDLLPLPALPPHHHQGGGEERQGVLPHHLVLAVEEGEHHHHHQGEGGHRQGCQSLAFTGLLVHVHVRANSPGHCTTSPGWKLPTVLTVAWRPASVDWLVGVLQLSWARWAPDTR